MVETVTPKMTLTKPEIGASANAWGNMLNGNMDIIDNGVVRLTKQWKIIPGDDTAGSATGPLQIKRYNNAEVEAGVPVTINRQTGDVTLANSITVSGTITAGNITAAGATITAVNVAASGSVTGATIYSTGDMNAVGAYYGGAISITGNITCNTFASNGTTLNGTTTAATLSATTYGGTNMALSGAISGNTIVANGITSNGNINAAGTLFVGGPIHVANTVYLEGSNTRYLTWDGTNYIMPSSHLYTAAGRLWGTGDFNYTPANAGSVVYSGRYIFAGDQSNSQGGGDTTPRNNFPGSTVSEISLTINPFFQLNMRWRYLQLAIGGPGSWVTIGNAS